MLRECRLKLLLLETLIINKCRWNVNNNLDLWIYRYSIGEGYSFLLIPRSLLKMTMPTGCNSIVSISLQEESGVWEKLIAVTSSREQINETKKKKSKAERKKMRQTSRSRTSGREGEALRVVAGAHALVPLAAAVLLMLVVMLAAPFSCSIVLPSHGDLRRRRRMLSTVRVERGEDPHVPLPT